MGCFKNAIQFVENPFHLIPSGIENVIQSVAPIALSALGQPELGAGLSAANAYANAPAGQGLGAGLKAGALNYGGSLLSGALGGGGSGTGGGSSIGGLGGSASGGSSSFLGDIGSSLSDAAKNVGNFTGIADVANGIGDAANNLGTSFSNTASDIGNATGLSDLYNSASTGINDLGNGLKSAANSVGNYIGVGNATDGFGNAIPRGSAADLLSGASNSTDGSGLLGSAGIVGRGITSLNNSIGGVGGSTGGSMGNSNGLGGTLATLAGGAGQALLNNQAKNDQLKQITAQQQNLNSFNPAGITSDPGYQFQYDQGLQGLQRQLAAAGGTQSGGALKAATQYGQNYANSAFNDYYNRWASQTGAENQLLANKGNVQANSLLGQGQDLSQTLTNAFNPQSSLASILGKKLLGA